MRQTTKYVVRKIGTEIERKERKGKFSVTAMRIKKVKTAADISQRDYVPEVSMDVVRTCIQRSVYSKREQKYVNQQIWVGDNEELRDLRDLITAFLDEEGPDEGSSFSSKAQEEENGPNRVLCHRIVEYMRMSGVEFDTVDLEDDLRGLLQSWGWEVDLSEEELQLILDDLYPIALSHEFAEVSRTYYGDNVLKWPEDSFCLAQGDD